MVKEWRIKILAGGMVTVTPVIIGSKGRAVRDPSRLVTVHGVRAALEKAVGDREAWNARPL